MILRALRAAYTALTGSPTPTVERGISPEAIQRAREMLSGVTTCWLCGGMVTDVLPARETITGKIVHPLCYEFERQRRRLRG